MVDQAYSLNADMAQANALQYIPKGMVVYDITGKKVGTVKYFQAPSASINPDLAEFPPELRSSSMPDEMIYRMLNAGFICVNAGVLAKNRFVMLHQIDHIWNDKVHLRVVADTLIKA